MNTQTVGRALVLLIGGVLVLTGVFKLVGGEEDSPFDDASVPVILAVVEFAVAAAIFIPRTRLLGVLLAASYFGGVICFQWLTEGEVPVVGAAINAVLYVGAALCWPGLRDGGRGVVTI